MMKEIREQLQRVRQDISHICEVSNRDRDGNETKIRLPSDVELLHENVRVRLSPVDSAVEDKTVAYMIFSKNGLIREHSNDRQKRIHVISGSYIDETTGRVWKEGEVQTIDTNTLHSLRSDDAIIIVVWYPPYQYFLNE